MMHGVWTIKESEEGETTKNNQGRKEIVSEIENGKHLHYRQNRRIRTLLYLYQDAHLFMIFQRPISAAHL
jgi:hypothetical protein